MTGYDITASLERVQIGYEILRVINRLENDVIYEREDAIKDLIEIIEKTDCFALIDKKA